ncbi:MAG: RES family NAD+ phosphorylase [Deltaproteobacteria bacterium]|nr:RES family NAD+ phosphorylase [Deltaproteobacteria bacterium]
MRDRVWRITKERYATNDPLSCEGARLAPGRWHPKGIPVLYTAFSLSLAALEAFVHLPSRRWLPSDLIAVEIDISAISVEEIDHTKLPNGWDAPFPLGETQEIGARWVKEQRTCGLDVPSAVIPYERNLLLNPAHPGFSRATVLGLRPFRFDARMAR